METDTQHAQSSEFRAAELEGRSESGLDLEAFLPYRLSVLSNTVSKSIARLYADRFGLTIPEWRVLAVLGRFGPISAAEICQATAMDKVQVSRAVQRLISGKLASRKTDADDRRRSVISMTTRGRSIHDQIVPLALSREQLLIEGLDETERAQLWALFDKLAHQAERMLAEEATAG